MLTSPPCSYSFSLSNVPGTSFHPRIFPGFFPDFFLTPPDRKTNRACKKNFPEIFSAAPKTEKGEGSKTSVWGDRPIIPRSWLALATATEVLRTPAEKATASNTCLGTGGEQEHEQ